jgi:ABC-type glycerol-3-phosphate transport system permease component
MRTPSAIVIPLLAPVIGTAAILTAILTWNEFLFGSSLGSAGTQTAPSALLSFTGLYGTRYDLLSAASLMVAAPVILLAIILRRRLVSGLTLGAVK